MIYIIPLLLLRLSGVLAQDDEADVKGFCACAEKYGQCDASCPDLLQYVQDDDTECWELAIKNICRQGGPVNSAEKYSDFCPAHGHCDDVKGFCECAEKYDKCDGQCPDLIQYITEDDTKCWDLAVKNICREGGPVNSADSYNDFCPSRGHCDANIRGACKCAEKYGVCGLACPDLFSHVSGEDTECFEYAVSSICGGAIPIEKQYTEFCPNHGGHCSCAKADNKKKCKQATKEGNICEYNKAEKRCQPVENMCSIPAQTKSEWETMCTTMSPNKRTCKIHGCQWNKSDKACEPSTKKLKCKKLKHVCCLFDGCYSKDAQMMQCGGQFRGWE